jgi:hypothetical protein
MQHEAPLPKQKCGTKLNVAVVGGFFYLALPHMAII